MKVGPDHARHVAKELRSLAMQESAGFRREIMQQSADTIDALIKQAFLTIPIPRFLQRKR